MSKTKDLKSGTKLPLMSLKGKDYLQVAHRLVWFREEHPLGKIQTEAVFSDETRAVFKATVSVPDLNSGAWLELSSGHKSEQKGRFADFLEKAETGAIGRALAVAGYGTQFEPEFDEEDRIVDSPLQAANKASGKYTTPKEDAPKPAPTQTVAPKTVSITVGPGETLSGVIAEKATDREALNKRITAMSKVVIAKRLKTLDELKADMKRQYGADSTADLDEHAAKNLLEQLTEMAHRSE